MIEQSFSDPKTLLRLRSGPLGAHIDGFTLKLSEQGYARFSVKYKIGVVNALGVWLHRRHLDAEDVNEQRIREFILYRRCAALEAGSFLHIVLGRPAD